MRQDTTGDRINTLWEDKQTLKAERGNIEKKNVLKIDKINKKTAPSCWHYSHGQKFTYTGKHGKYS